MVTAALAVLSMSLLGCQPAGVTTPARLYAPGQRWAMTVRHELRDNGIGVSESHFSSMSPDGTEEDTLVERTETKRSSVEWLELNLSLDVKPSAWPGNQDISIKVDRLATGYSGKDDKGVERSVSCDSSTGKAVGSVVEVVNQPEDQLRTFTIEVSFHVTADQAGWIVAYEACGGLFDAMMAELAKDGRLTREQKDLALRLQSCGVFSGFAETAAYLPPADVAPGRTWRVVRDKVLPHHAYGFYMFTNGCGYSTEDSTCEAVSVERTPGGRIVTVRITGRRVPEHPEPSMPRRVDYMATTGELKFNLDTSEVISLHIEEELHMISAEDRKYIAVEFATDVTLKKR